MKSRGRCRGGGYTQVANLLQMKITGSGERSGGITGRGNHFSRFRWWLAANVVFAAATDFHYMRLLGVLTILAAILAVLFCRTIAGWMRACFFLIFCHKQPLLSGEFGCQ